MLHRRFVGMNCEGFLFCYGDISALQAKSRCVVANFAMEYIYAPKAARDDCWIERRLASHSAHSSTPPLAPATSLLFPTGERFSERYFI